MDDIIHLLPDAVANQIAAGEVVQRPASAVKELLENAIDAGASHIQLVIKDAGRTLIQVIDNGKGMSFQDARICFERHATSKITKAEDLFSIRTKGFRGEALASIASIAQVELKTKRPDDEMGTSVVIEGSVIQEHSPTATQDGTIISVKNLFFNVPARRNFLKSDATEFGNIEEEFYRVAIVHHDIAFDLYHNGKLVYQLKSANFKQRVVSIFGNHFNGQLFPIEHETNFIKISGFLGKPENAKKRRSEQYMFLNERFVKSSSLNYAIESAYNQLIPDGSHPPYFIRIEVDPAKVDVNISPTKIEVKLQDDRLVFGFLNAAVRKAIGEHSLVPQLNFDYDTALDLDNVPDKGSVQMPTLHVDPNYNPFRESQTHKPAHSSSSFTYTGHPRETTPDWERFLSEIKDTTVNVPEELPPTSIVFQEEITPEEIHVDSYIVAHKRYLIVKLNEELNVVDIIRANERVIYEMYLHALKEKPIVVQQSLFPETITLSMARAEMLLEVKEEIHRLGYDIEPMSQCQFAVNGTPNDDENGNIQELIENLLDDFTSNRMSYRTERDKGLALCMAKQKRSAMKPLNSLEEVNCFLQTLFSTMMPSITPSGKKVYEKIEVDSLMKLLQ